MMQLGPVWNPAWISPQLPSSLEQTQQALHSLTTPVPQALATHAAAVLSPEAGHESASEFGSFTGHDSQPAAWFSAQHIESARDYIPEEDIQAPTPLHAVVMIGQNGSEEVYAANALTSRPATAAARASLLQSMDQSAPISLSLFGEESYEDASLDLPATAQPAPVLKPLSETAPSSPGVAHTPTWGLDQAIRSAPTQLLQATEDAFEPSWQQAEASKAPSSSWLSDQTGYEHTWHGAAPSHSTPSSSWLPGQAGSGLEIHWQTTPDSHSFSASALPDQSQFAATWPQPTTDAASQLLPDRQAGSGPISLELFGLEDREDEPLALPLQLPTQAGNTVASDMLGNTNQATDSSACEPVSSPRRQISPRATPLQLFEMEETKDESLTLPVQATPTLLPSAGADANEHTGLCHAHICSSVHVRCSVH